MNKEEIYNTTEGGRDIFSQFFGEQVSLRKKYLSPFYNDTVKSCSFTVKNGIWRFTDFGNKDEYSCLDCIGFVMKYYGVDYNTSIIYISNNSLKYSHKPIIQYKKTPSVITVEPREYNNQDERYWNKYGLSKEDIFPLIPCSYYTINGRIFNSHSNNPIIYYIKIEDRYKIYSPLNTNKAYKCIGNTDNYSIIRTSIRDNSDYNDYQIILAGQKDLIVFEKHLRLLFEDKLGKKVNSICLNSEATTKIPDEIFINIKRYGARFLSLYDNDKDGRKYALKLNENHFVRPLDISLVTELNDLSDYIEEGIKLNRLEEYKLKLIDII